MKDSKFPETPKELKEFLQAITPLQIEHLFLNTLLWDNSSILASVAYAYRKSENENYLIVSLYDLKSRKTLSQVIWLAGFDERTGKIMTTVETEDKEVLVMYGGDTVAWLQSSKTGKLYLVAKRGKEKRKILITGLEAYKEDF